MKHDTKQCRAVSRFTNRCPYCLMNRRRRGNYRGHLFYIQPAPITEDLSTMIRRQSASTKCDTGAVFAARDVVMEAEYPLMTEYLVTRTFEDGSERETSTLLVFAAEGVWKVCLNDRAEQRALWASGASYGDALAALEKLLDSGAETWRPYKPYKKGK